MSVIVYTEIKNDLESVYKNTSEMLTLLQSRSFEHENNEIRDLIEFIKFKLKDIEGTVQKDIFNCDYISTVRQCKVENYQRSYSEAFGENEFISERKI